MSKKTDTAISLVLVILTILPGVVYYPRLPDRVPIHWNFRGEADSFAPKMVGAFLLPAISLLVLIIDSRENARRHLLLHMVFSVVQVFAVLKAVK
jgi:uncharacterized membrane protein